MSFSDLIDAERGPAALVKFALYPLILLVVFSLVLTLLSQLGAAPLLLVLLFLIFASPIAYFIREARQGRPRGPGTRRAAERTPLLPPNEGDE